MINKKKYYIVLKRFYYKTEKGAKDKKQIDSNFHTGYIRKSSSGWSYVRILEI